MDEKEKTYSILEVEAILKSLRYLSLNKSIDDAKGRELTGALWGFVKSEFAAYRCFSLDFGGIEVVINGDMGSLMFKYEQILQKVENDKIEKEIAVEANRSTTKSYWVALVSLILSIISMCISIYTLIYK